MPVTNLPQHADSGALPARVLGVFICLPGGSRGQGPLIQLSGAYSRCSLGKDLRLLVVQNRMLTTLNHQESDRPHKDHQRWRLR